MVTYKCHFTIIPFLYLSEALYKPVSFSHAGKVFVKAYICDI